MSPRAKKQRIPGPAGSDIVTSLAYAIFHGKLSLDEAVAQLVQPRTLAKLGEPDIQATDDLTASVSDQFPDLAYALAVLNDAAARHLASSPVRGRCALRLGTLIWQRGQLEEATRLLEEAADLCRQAGDVEGEIMAMGNLGNVLFAQGDTERAISIYQQEFELARLAGNPTMAGIADMCLANVLSKQGRYDEALEYYRRSLQAERDAANLDLQIACMEKMRDAYADRARLYRQAKQADQAIADLEHVVNLSHGLGDHVNEASYRLDLSGAYMEQGNPQAALDCLVEGLARVQGTGDPGLEIRYQVDLSQVYEGLDRTADARTCLERAARLGQEMQDPAMEGRVRGQLGKLLREMGDAASAVEQLRLSHPLCRQAGDPHGLSLALYHLAMSYRDLQQEDTAIETARQAAEGCDRDGQSFLWGETRSLLGELYYRRIRGDRVENLEQAISCWQSALTAISRETHAEAWARAQHNLGLAYTDRIRGRIAENVEAAISAFQAVLGVHTRDSDLEMWATTLSNLAQAYGKRREGDRAANLEQTIACCRAVLDACDSKSHFHAWVHAQVNLGNAYRERVQGDRAENLEIAIAALEQAVDHLDRETDPKAWSTVQSNLGACYYERVRGDRAANLEIALAHYQTALEACDRQAMPREWATYQNDMGNVYRKRKVGDRVENLQRASEAMEAALTVFTRQADPIQWSRGQLNLGAISMDLADEQVQDQDDHIERAIACFGEALTERSPENFPLEWANTQSNLGAAYLLRQRGDKADNLARAAASLEQSVEAARRLGLDTFLAGNAQNLAEVWLAQEKWTEAHSALEQAIAALERLEAQQATDTSRRAYLRQAAPLYADDVFCLAMLGKAEAALERLESGRTRFLSEVMTREDSRLAALTPRDRQAFIALRNQLKALEDEQLAPGSRPWTDLAAALRETRQQFQMVVEGIRCYAPDFMPKSLSGKEIQSLVDDDQTALATWAVTRLGTVIFIISQAGGLETRIVHDFVADDLLHLLIEGINAEGRPVGGWMGGYDRYQIVTATEPRPADIEREAWFAPLSRLWEPLLAPIHERLHTLAIHRLILIPYGKLHLLPLHAVGQPCLVDDYEIIYAPSATVLSRCRERSGEPERTAARGALLVCHSGGTLQFAQAEVKRIMALLTQRGEAVHMLAEEQATREQVEALAAGCRWLHFACHGKYNWADPLESGLWLAGPDDELNPYVVWEILARLDLRLTRLVTLSACETGLTESFDLPEEFVGLPASFLMAGASTVVGSLWTVNDLSTMLLMERFYTHHLNGMALPAALREAQRWVRDMPVAEIAAHAERCYREADEENKAELLKYMLYYRHVAGKNPHVRPFEHPYHWAAFTVNGV